jgi:hypothetical protein
MKVNVFFVFQVKRTLITLALVAVFLSVSEAQKSE